MASRTRCPTAAGSLLAALPLLLALVGLAALPGDAGAQRSCDLVDSQGESRFISVPGGRIFYLRRPVFRCADGTRLRADSAVVNTARNFTNLYRDVFYEDSTRILVADTAQYFSRAGRLQAQGNVRLTSTADSSTLTGQNLLYLRENEIRPRAQLTMTGGRPHAVLYPAEGDDPAEEDDPPAVGDPPGEEERPAPYEVDADRIFVEGEELFRATGTVEVTREDLQAFGDEVEYDRPAGRMLLRPNGRIVSEGYDLTGESVLLVLPEDELREVVATGDASLTGEDLDLTAPEIRLYLEDGAMERLVAARGLEGAPAEIPQRPDELAPPGGEAEEGEEGADEARPEALAQEFLLRADSIDVRLPGEVLETLHAVGRARGESLSRDSLNTEDTPPLIRRDWIEGDTIVATFAPDSAAVGDSAVVVSGARVEEPAAEPAEATPAEGSRAVTADSTPRRAYRLERLVASGNARTLYRLEPSDSAAVDTAARPADADTAAAAPGERLAVHYVTGRRITIRMQDGEVEWMEVEGQTRGLHATPTARRPRGRANGSPEVGGGISGGGGLP